MKNPQKSAASLVFLFLMVFSIPLQAQILMMAKGNRQGDFRGNSEDSQSRNKIVVNGFSFSENLQPNNSPLNLSSNYQHEGIKINTAMDGSSLQFFNAFSSNESLEIEIDFYGPTKSSGSALIQTIKLKNAKVTAIHQSAGNLVQTSSTNSNERSSMIATITLSYQRMDMENLVDKISFMDNWYR